MPPKSKIEKRNIILFIALSFIVSRVIMYIIAIIYDGSWRLADIMPHFNTEDAEWYKQYVQDLANGTYFYRPASGHAMWAFFPLYPAILLGFLKLLPSVPLDFIGPCVSSVCFCVSEYFAYRYIMLTRKNVKIAFAYIFLMSFGPYSLYFSITYTESLFVLLLILCFYFLKTRNYPAMGLCGALLSATRNTGVFFVFVIAAERIMDYVKKPGKKSIGLFFKENFSDAKLVLGVALVPLGLFLYMLYLSVLLGDGLAFVHVQIAWGRKFVGVLHALYYALTDNIFNIYLACTFVGIFAILFCSAIRKRNFDELVYPAITILSSAVSSLMSTPRYAVSAFTVELLISEFIAARRKSVQVAVFIAAILIEAVITYCWLMGVRVLV